MDFETLDRFKELVSQALDEHFQQLVHVRDFNWGDKNYFMLDPDLKDIRLGKGLSRADIHSIESPGIYRTKEK